MDDWAAFGTLDDWSALFHDDLQDLFADINFTVEQAQCTSYDLELGMVPGFNFLTGYDNSLIQAPGFSSISEGHDTSPLLLQNVVEYIPSEDVLHPSQSFVPAIELSDTLPIPEHPPSDNKKDQLVESQRSKAKKLKWNDSIVVFPARADSRKTHRERKSFGNARRKEVALTRRVGACVQCKLKKTSCNLGLPCQQCIKRAGSSTLSRELCTRQSLLAVRFDNIDLYPGYREETEFVNLTYNLIPGTERTAYMTYPTCCEHSSTWLKVKVQDHEGLSCPESRLSTLITWTSDSWYESSLPDDHDWVFVRNCLPYVDDLIRCRNGGKYHQCDSGPFAGLHKAFSEFGEHYCKMGRKLPLSSLLTKVLRMKGLLLLYRTSALIKEDIDSPVLEWAATPMVIILTARVRKALVEVESEVLFELERIIFSANGIGKQNPIVIWVCLWLLILHYQSVMPWVGVIWYNDASVFQPLHNLARHLYHTLTAIYSALYRTTSPLTLDWRTDEISELLGKDSELIRLFCDIKTEMYWFHSEKDRLCSRDALFKTLVVENERRLLMSHIKTAKQKGIL